MGKGVPGWSVQRERVHLWSLHTGNIENAHQSDAGTVPDLPKVPVQYGPSIHVQSGRGHTPELRVLGIGASNPRGTGVISPTDEVRRASVDGKNTLEY